MRLRLARFILARISVISARSVSSLMLSLKLYKTSNSSDVDVSYRWILSIDLDFMRVQRMTDLERNPDDVSMS